MNDWILKIMIYLGTLLVAYYLGFYLSKFIGITWCALKHFHLWEKTSRRGTTVTYTCPRCNRQHHF